MEVTIEKLPDGTYTAYNTTPSGLVAIGTGQTLQLAKEDFENSLAEIASDLTPSERAKLITAPHYCFDVASLFEYFKVINVSAFAAKTGINASLLRQYKMGQTYISERQLTRIEDALHTLGKELCSIKLK